MIDFNAVPDEDLYGMCREGDEGAWEYTFNYILTICRWKKWTLNVEPRELAQQITLHLIEKALGKVKERNKFRSFIAKTAINKIKDSFKSKWGKRESIEMGYEDGDGGDLRREIKDPKPSHEKILVDLETVCVVEAAILKLPVSCREVLREYLKYKMGGYKDYKELSGVLGMPVPTVSAKVRRCLDKLLASKEMKELMAD
jgi:RNA polymerase sigma factor (sigma-70 family)